jgi:hypothetical protein
MQGSAKSITERTQAVTSGWNPQTQRFQVEGNSMEDCFSYFRTLESVVGGGNGTTVANGRKATNGGRKSATSNGAGRRTTNSGGTGESPPNTRRRISAEGRKRIALAQKRRWANARKAGAIKGKAMTAGGGGS